jgi:hypothetical protein
VVADWRRGQDTQRRLAQARQRHPADQSRQAAAGLLDIERWAQQFPMAAAFGQLARDLFDAPDVEAVARRVVAAAARVIDGADVASMTVLTAQGRFGPRYAPTRWSSGWTRRSTRRRDPVWMRCVSVGSAWHAAPICPTPPRRDRSGGRRCGGCAWPA